MRKLLLFALVLLVQGFSVSYAQDMKVTGIVYDTTGTRPLPNALAMAVRVQDSVLLGFTRTDHTGSFTLIGFQPDTFNLIVEHPDFDERNFFIFGNSGNAEIDIPQIRMNSKSQLIDEVIIYANRNPIFFKGDTLVYVADSFAVHENAVVEDLLKKLPGITVDKDGNITSQGRTISQVLVDGDEFFGSDPTIATKNLGAKGVDQVQVYEKENENGTFGDDEKIQVLDLKLKEDAKKGYFGRITAGTDFAFMPDNNGFYEGELLLNKFNGSQKISIFALGSNTPRSSLGWGDARKFGLENEETTGGRWGGGNQGNTSGIPQTLKAGIYYSDKYGKKKNTKLNFNYSYYNMELDARSASRSQYFLSDTTYFTDDSTRNYDMNESHRFNLEVEMKLDSLTTLSIDPSFRYDKADNEKNDISSFIGEDGITSLTTDVLNSSASAGTEFNTDVNLVRKFKKPKREFELEYQIEAIENQTTGNLLSQTNYLLFSGFNDTTDQSKMNNNSQMAHYATMYYTEPMGKYFKLITGYMFEVGNSDQRKETYDRVGSTYSSFNANLSNIFENTRVQHRGGLKLDFESRKHSAGARLDVRNIDILNENLITMVDVRQNFTNLLPAFDYAFKPSMSKRFNFRYNTYSSQPSIGDLQPVPDNTNPNRVKIGNQELRPNYTHSFSVNFNTWEAMSGKYLWSGLNAQIVDDAFATSTNYDSYGRTISQTVNVDGNANASLYAGAGYPVWGRKITFQPSGNVFFNRFTGFVNDERNTTDNLGLGGGLEVRLQMDSLEITVSNRYDYTSPKSTLSSTSNTPFSTQYYMARFMYRMPLGFKIETDANYTVNSQRAEGYNLNFLIINAEFGKTFLKTENLFVSIVGRDLLNQNINAQREVNGNIITDNRTKIISRYFLLKATLRFNNRKTKEEDFNGWH